VGAAGLATGSAAGPRPQRAQPRFAVGIEQLAFADPTRTVSRPGQPRGPRTLTTVIRYPAVGPASRVDARDAAPDRAAGPFPLIVFGHGFAVTPATYFRLLRAWAQAGYVVAAPVFPLENAHAPGGPKESDLVNQPRDMSVVISGMLATADRRDSLLHGMIAPRQIGVSGQSDGGVTALAVAYDRFYRDPRVSAAVILSGAHVLGSGPPLPGPPLLATQGTVDAVNNPANTYTFFNAAHRPKFLLRLIGAGHLPPYTTQQPQLTIVERVTVAFLDRYLKRARGALERMTSAINRPGVATLLAEP
jgi:dienelactone hydrolase